MKHSGKPNTIRRSVALSGALVEELSALAPADLHGNWNRLVTVAMAAMAVEPGIRAECADIAKEFSTADLDGLKNDQPRSDLFRLAGPDSTP